MEHFLDAKGVKRDVCQRLARFALCHPAHAMGAIFDKESAGIVSALRQPGSRRIVHNAICMLGHHGAQLARSIKRIGVDHGRVKRHLAIPRHKACHQNGIDRCAAGEQLSRHLAWAHLGVNLLKRDLHAIAGLEHQEPVGRIGAGARSHDLSDRCFLLRACHRGLLYARRGIKRLTIAERTATSGIWREMAKPNVTMSAGTPPTMQYSNDLIIPPPAMGPTSI